MLRNELFVVYLDSIVPDLVDQALLFKLLLFGCSQSTHLISHKWVIWSPFLHSRAWTLANQSSHVHTLILLIHLGDHLIEIGVLLIHPWVTSLTKSSILLVLLDGRCLRNLSLESAFKLVEFVFKCAVLVMGVICALAVEQG